jgi:hypothetical protein
MYVPKAERLMAADHFRQAIMLTVCGLSQAMNQSIGGLTGLISSMSLSSSRSSFSIIE